MKLTFKTVQQTSFQLEVDPSITVGNLKKEIQTSQGHDPSLQKLIYSGKILQDDNDIASYNIAEKDFIVVMVAKPKPAATTSAAPSSPVKASVPAPAVTATTTPASTNAAFDASTLATGSAYEAAVKNLIEMGFEASQVKAAMRAAFNNPDRAAEYLMTGIPDNIAAEEASTESVAAAPSETGEVNLFEAAQTRQQGPTATTGDALNALSFLRTSPQFQQLRQVVQTQPHLLQPLLQQLGASNPQLLQMINQNQDAFMQLLMEGGDMEGEDDMEGGAPGVQYIQLTPEENEAVNRLTALGFDRALAAEAYLACDKNEELAANYLFDMGMEEQ